LSQRHKIKLIVFLIDLALVRFHALRLNENAGFVKYTIPLPTGSVLT
jgi:hypothetical protein